MTPRPDSCPACGAAALREFHEQHGVPVHSCLLLDDPDEARAFPTGSIVLAFCEACGFVTNTAFSSEHHRYSERYEETQGFSAHFQGFARALAERWIDRHELRGRSLVEIGCGKGEFLLAMCELGDNRAVGIDPAYVPSRLDPGGRITFVQRLYDAGYGPLDADAVICRHTLEHIHPVGRFLDTVRAGIGARDAVVLFELPDVRRVLEEVAFWDVYYEHCSYFSLGSLARAFRGAGFEVTDLAVDFGDQYLLLEARPAPTAGCGAPLAVEDDLEAMAKAVDHYADEATRRIEGWRRSLREARDAGERLAIWGSGSKGVAFLTTLGVVDEVEHVVDINPHKHGRYMAGTGHRIEAPEALRDAPPDLVVVMNPEYRVETEAHLASLGVDARVLAL
jgi:hypothetical protein